MNRKDLFLYLLLCMTTTAVYAQELPPWNDPSVNNINRKELTSDFFAFESVSLAEKNVKNASGRFMSIEGDWKFHWVKTPMNVLLISIGWIWMTQLGNHACAWLLGAERLR